MFEKNELKLLNLFAEAFCREVIVKRSWKRRRDLERKLKKACSARKKENLKNYFQLNTVLAPEHEHKHKYRLGIRSTF